MISKNKEFSIWNGKFFGAVGFYIIIEIRFFVFLVIDIDIAVLKGYVVTCNCDNTLAPYFISVLK